MSMKQNGFKHLRKSEFDNKHRHNFGNISYHKLTKWEQECFRYTKHPI